MGNRHSIDLLRNLTLWLMGLALIAGGAAPLEAAVQRLTHDDRPDHRPAVNSMGQVAWSIRDVLHPGIYFWNGRTVQLLSTNVIDGVGPFVSETGHVLWRGYGDSSLVLLLWDGRRIHELGPIPSVAMPPRMNAAGQVVWQGLDRTFREIFLWDGVRVRQLTRNGDNWNPRINRAGHVVWERQGEILLWDGRRVRTLTPGNHLVWTPRFPQINDVGQVAWYGQDTPPRHHGLSLWDGTRIRQIDDTPEGSLQQLQLSNTGTVAFMDNARRSLYLWDGTSTRRLAVGLYEPYFMNRTGQVVWSHQGGIYLWDGTAVRQLGHTNLVTPEFQINDAGQVVWQVQSGSAGEIQIVRWEGGSAQVISLTGEDQEPGVLEKRQPQLSSAGHVVWVGDMFRGSTEVFLYTPPAPGSIELDADSVLAGRRVTGRVSLPEAAAAGGTTVTLTSSDASVATVPPTLTVPGGATSAEFAVTTLPVPSDSTVTITAASGGQTWTASLRVRRPGIDLPGGLTQLTAGYGGPGGVRLSDTGHVAWRQGGPQGDVHLFLWKGLQVRAVQELTADPAASNLAILDSHQINARGHLLWMEGPPDRMRPLFWDGQSVRPVTELDTPRLAILNDQDQILWTSGSDQEATLWLWDGTVTRALDRRIIWSAFPAMNNHGHVVWRSRDGQIQFWDGASTRTLTNDNHEHAAPQINDRDQILWIDRDYYGGRGTAVALWENGTTRWLEIDPHEVKLNNAGWIAWQSRGKVYLWDRSTSQLLNPDGPPGGVIQMNDAGQVVWRTEGATPGPVFFWDGLALRQLGRTNLLNYDPRINNVGQVAWSGGDYSDTQIYLYTPPLSLAVEPSAMTGGETARGTVTLGQAAPAGGAVVKLLSRSPELSIPAQVMVPAGESSMTFPITSAAVTRPTTVALIAVVDDVARPARMTLLPADRR